MRATDVARLSTLDPEDVDNPDSGAMAALGMDIPEWRRLQEAILADFTEQPPYGIGWWAPHPGTSRRILIANQLYACADSVGRNMMEAALHWLEFLDCSDRDNARFADTVKIENGRPRLSMPKPRTALEQLSPGLVKIHLVGVIRALASALDCLSGVIIGVAALPTNILKADFTKARNALKKISGTGNDTARMQAQFADRLEATIAAAGPGGWLEWTLDFRNMLVHRGRRFEFGQFLPNTPVLYGPNAQPLIRVRRVTHLPRDPGRSDVEVLLDAPWSLVLTEEAEETLRGLMSSTKAMLESTAKELLQLWEWRRRNPQTLRQPLAQWRNGRSTQSTGFNGYAPGTLELKPEMGIVHPVMTRQFRSAALFDESRDQWDSFD